MCSVAMQNKQQGSVNSMCYSSAHMCHVCVLRFFFNNFYLFVFRRRCAIIVAMCVVYLEAIIAIIRYKMLQFLQQLTASRSIHKNKPPHQQP